MNHKLYYFFNINIVTSNGLMSRVFASGPEDQGSISGRIIPKVKKKVLDAALLNSVLYGKDQG